MLLIKAGRQGVSFIMVLWLMASNVGCANFSHQSPGQAAFEYRKELLLVKEGDCITITRTPVYSSAQKSPAAEYDRTPQTVLIGEKDFSKIWKQLLEIDFDRLKNPGDSDFIDTPPDMSHAETLRLVINGKTEVDWGYPYRILTEPLRNPLVELNNLLRRIHEERLARHVIPDRCFLETTIKQAGEVKKCSLRKNGRRIEIELVENDSTTADNVKSVSKSEFKKLWSDLLKLNLLDIPLHMTVPVEPGVTLVPVYNMTLEIEGAQKVRFSAAPGFAGQENFEAIWDKLESLWQSKR